MASATSPALVTLLRRQKLLEPAHLAEVEQSLAAQYPKAKTLARELLQRGWLTTYQFNQIAEGHGADLRLGNYVILERLGEGGMGAVLKARHDKMGRVVALKVIRKERLTSPEAAQRFQQEVRAAAQLNHPNIVQAYDADCVNGMHFLAMEFVEGIDLANWVQQHGPLPVADVCACLRQTALALQHAHERGLVHRDIKPANLLRSSAGGGSVKILDMGIARLTRGGDTEPLTQEGAVMGSLDYIAPEQAMDSRKADIRADLYSLGCTGYFLLTGQVPFPGGEALAKLSRHQFEAPVQVEQLRPEVPPYLASIIRKLMAKRPDERYQTPKELTEALAGHVRPHPKATLGIALPQQPAAEVQSTVSYAPVPSRPRRRAWLVAVVGGLALVAAAVLVVFFLSRSRPAPPPTPAPPSLTPEEELKQLLVRVKDNTLPPEQRRDKVFAFCLKYAGQPVAYQAGPVLLTLPPLENTIGMKLAAMPPGTFVMGSAKEVKDYKDYEGPQHKVTLTRPFYLGVYEVTVGQFRTFVKETGYRTEAEAKKDGGAARGEVKGKFDPQLNWQRPGFDQTGDHPVVCVSWNDAQAFCHWLSQKEGQNYALPTEAQWEYCCRAGSQTGFGSDVMKNTMPDYSWTLRNSANHTHPVGQKRPNTWGLYDMYGNAAEWTADGFDKDFYQASPEQDPLSPATAGRDRVLRGGSWNVLPFACSPARRFPTPPFTRSDTTGFRIVQVQ